MRVKTHPDRLKKPETSEEEAARIDMMAAEVGEAADVLLDSIKVISTSLP